MPTQVWRRGDPIVRGNEPGFVAADMGDGDEYLAVRWQGGLEKVPRADLGSIRRFTEAEENAVRSVGRSQVADLRALESLEGIEVRLAERARTIKTQGEQRWVDDLIRRGFTADPECEWDRKYATLLCVLALEPDSVGWLFRLRERLHRPIHRLFHTPRA